MQIIVVSFGNARSGYVCKQQPTPCIDLRYNNREQKPYRLSWSQHLETTIYQSLKLNQNRLFETMYMDIFNG